MSFVGPRPVVFDDIETIILRNEKKLVNNIKPGLTGLAQINGRSKITIPEKIKYEEIYKEKMCFMLDIIIILKTNYYLIQENIFKKTVKNRKSEQLPYIHIGLTNVENTIF
jgi:O-antigen biosynthesis protein WbqP